MRDKSLGIVAAIGIIVLVVAYFLYQDQAAPNIAANEAASGYQINIAGVIAPEQQAFRARTLTSITATSSINNYDGFRSATTSPYQVPADNILDIMRLTFTGSTSTVRLTLGYGDNSIVNSTTTPTNFVVLWRANIPAVEELHTVPVYVRVPAGKYPAALMEDTAGQWAGPVNIIGMETPGTP